MRLLKAHEAFLWFAVTYFGSLAPAAVQAQVILAPNGDPTGDAAAVSPVQPDGHQYIVSLSPQFADSAFPFPPAPLGQHAYSEFDIINNCLAAQGLAWRVTGNFALQGNVRLDDYHAYVETMPAVNQGTLPHLNAVNRPGGGGASLGVHYLPQGADPVSIHWLQLVHTNDPSGNSATWTLPYDQPGFVWYIDDNGGNVSPFYDLIGATANGTDFYDSPYRPYRDNSQWNGYLYMAVTTADDVAQAINVQGGVWWGIHDPVVPVPESGTLALTATGCLVLSATRLARCSRQGNRVSPIADRAFPTHFPTLH